MSAEAGNVYRSNRLPFIDNLYTIGILLVLFGHSHSSDWGTFSGTVLESAINFIYLFHMPLFFFIAGNLFMNSKSMEKLGYGIWIRDKAIKLLTPYLVLSLLAAVPKYYFETGTISGLVSSVVKGILAPRLGVWGHFWFIPVLLFVYVFFGLLKKLIPNVKWLITEALMISLILYFMPIQTMWLGWSDVKAVCIFFAVGMLIHEIEGVDDYKKTYCILGMVVGIVVSLIIAPRCNGNPAFSLVAALLMISVCCLVSRLIRENRFCTYISKHNFTIYIYSWLFQAIVMYLCDRFHFQWYVESPIMFLSGLLMPLAMITIYEHLRKIQNPVFNLILGVK